MTKVTCPFKCKWNIRKNTSDYYGVCSKPYIMLRKDGASCCDWELVQ